MRHLVVLVLALAACKGEDEPDPATLTILSPEDGATVDTVDVALSIVVENFELVPVGGDGDRSHAPGSRGHNEGVAEGYAEVTLDGAFALDMDDTQATLEGLTAGEHTIDIELLFEDGDALDPAVTAPSTFTVAPPE